MSYIKVLFTALSLFIITHSFAQLPFGLVDNRKHPYCKVCQEAIKAKPKEALFGIDIRLNGDIYFSMDNAEWFNKILPLDAYGVAVDLVPKDRYRCNEKRPADFFALPRGTILQPVYRKDLLAGNMLGPNRVYTKIGRLPPGLMKKQVEGNLIILNGNYICFYTNFLDIERASWQLLPMGLFTDSLLRSTPMSMTTDTVGSFFTYTKKIQLEVPFQKSASKADAVHLKALYDSIQLAKYSIRRVELRAYSSVEGPLNINQTLMKRRADTILKALKKYDVSLNRVKVITAENWIEFFRDIDSTKFSGMAKMSKLKIKQQLVDKQLQQEMEPVLSKERKAVITLYLEEKTEAAKIPKEKLVGQFNIAVVDNKIDEARQILRELVERIIDNQLPWTMIDQLVVPHSKEYLTLLNDREVYRLLVRGSAEYQALENFLKLRELDPTNGRINYNICALRFFTWQYDNDSISPGLLWKEINDLQQQGIDMSLVKRMQINYHIMKSEQDLGQFDYAGKDISVNFIHETYRSVPMDDEDIYSLAKFFNYYSFPEWSIEAITPRIDKIDVSEDLVFYFVNLLFFYPDSYKTDLFRDAMLNAVNLNRQRFCEFFLPVGRGGAGMQLLDDEMLMGKYCEECTIKTAKGVYYTVNKD